MDRILIVSGTKKGIEAISESLKACGYFDFDTQSSGSGARRRLLECEYDLVLINTPLPDEFGSDLAISITQTNRTGVIMFVKAEMADSVSENVEDFGVFVIQKPFTRQILFQGIKFILATAKKISMINSEKMSLLKKVEDLKIVDRAKCALIEHLKMTEKEAHRYIEKTAMDTRKTKREIAESILAKYE